MNEADTCRKYVLPRLIAADWDNEPHSFTEQKTFTDGRIVVAGNLTHLCWKLWSTRWNRTGEHRRPKILYLADRNILIDDPKDKIFAPFGDARWKIENGEVNKGRELYFAIYQALAKDERRPGLYREYARDFFDLIVVDECHRGSARDESNWREILEYFEPAHQLGMTATPLRADNRDTYRYFGLRREKKDFFERYGPEAKVILNELLDKYAEHGTAQFVIPDALKVPPISEHGNVMEIVSLFGGAEKLRAAVNELQTLLYAA